MKLSLLVTWILALNIFLFAQQESLGDNRIIARAGDTKITAAEFQERFDFSPHPRKSESLDTALIKKEYLYTLIAEKLLAQKARSLNLDTAKNIEGILNYMDKLFVRDAFYKLKISSNVKVMPADMQAGEKRYSKLLVVKYLYSENKNEINKLYHELKSGVSIDSLLIKRPEHKEQKTPGTVTFGSIDQNLEDQLYRLSPGEISSPLRAGERWYVFKLVNIIDNPVFNNENTQFKIKKIIEDRKTDKLAKDFLYEFLGKQKVEVDKALFVKILDSIKMIIKEREAGNLRTETPFLILGADDFDRIMGLLGKENLNKPFIKFEKSPETAQNFLTQMKYISFKVDSAGVNNPGWVFNEYVKDYIQNELLVRAAYKQGVQNFPSVERDSKIWEDYYLSQKLERIIYDSISVTGEEAYNYFTKNNNLINYPDEVHVKEILADSLDKISLALKKINEGLSFEDAAKKYSVDDSLKRNGGDLGFFAVTSHGEIGTIAAEMKPGDIYGPVKTREGYALIKLIEKRKADKKQDTSFINIKDDLIATLKGIKLRKRLKKYVAGLAKEYGIKINNNVFNSVPVNRINTFTVRMIGFGGRIYAFPYQPLFGDWYSTYKSEVEQTPQ